MSIYNLDTDSLDKYKEILDLSMSYFVLNAYCLAKDEQWVKALVREGIQDQGGWGFCIQIICSFSQVKLRDNFGYSYAYFFLISCIIFVSKQEKNVFPSFLRWVASVINSSMSGYLLEYPTFSSFMCKCMRMWHFFKSPRWKYGFTQW